MPTSIPYPGKALRFGGSSESVRELQERLVELGLGPLKVDGVFGPKTVAAVKLYQTRRDLDVDGIVGRLTWTSLFALPRLSNSTAPNRLAGAALEVARTQVGVRETGGPNRGPQVEAYQKSTVNKPGSAYCMSFVYFCYDEGARRISGKNPLVRTAGVLDHWERARAEVKISVEVASDDISIIKPGAIFVIDHGDDKGHAGLVVAVTMEGLDTIEGNTNRRGSRDGEGVHRRTRKPAEINVGYLDYSRLAEIT